MMRQTCGRTLIVSFAAALMAGGAVADVTLTHSDYASDAEAGAALVAACKNAQLNDTVTVGEGRWLVPEPILLYRAIRLVAAQRADRTKTVIDGGGVTNLLMTYTRTTDVTGLVIDGFTFQNGLGMVPSVWENGVFYGAIALSGGMMTNCIVRNVSTWKNYYSSIKGVGVSLKGGAELVDTIVADIRGEDHERNWTRFLGGGVYADGASKVHHCTITNCQIYGSYGSSTLNDTAGGGVCLEGGSKAWNCEIANNVSSNVVELTDQANGGGGGAYVSGDGSSISNCYIHDNVAAIGATGILLEGAACACDCTVSNNVFRPGQLSGTKFYSGSCVVASGTGSRVRRCRVLDNTGSVLEGYNYWPGGLQMSQTTDAIVSDCIIRGNAGYGAGGVLFDWTKGGSMISNCVVQANVATGRGGAGILVRYGASSVTTVIADSYIVSNSVKSVNITASGVGYHQHASSRDTVLLRNCCLYGNRGGSGAINAFTDSGTHFFIVESCSVYDNPDDGISYYSDGSYRSSMSNMFVKGSVFINNGSNGNRNIMGFGAQTNIWYSYEPNGQWATTQTQYDYHNLRDSDFPEGAKIFVDAANGDYRMPKGGALCDKATKESWMGTGRRRGQQDMGDGTWTEAKSADWGVTVRRNNAVPRLSNGISDIGCFEYLKRFGMVFYIR